MRLPSIVEIFADKLVLFVNDIVVAHSLSAAPIVEVIVVLLGAGLGWTLVFNARTLHVVVEVFFAEAAVRILLLNATVLAKLVEIQSTLRNLRRNIVIARLVVVRAGNVV